MRAVAVQGPDVVGVNTDNGGVDLNHDSTTMGGCLTELNEAMIDGGQASAEDGRPDARRDVLSEQSEVLLDDDRRGSGAAADSDELWEEREGRNALRHVVGLGEMQDVTEVEYRKVRLERVVLVGVWSSAVTTQAQAEESLRELAALAETAGAEVCDGLLQHRYRPDAATYVGSGKAKEIAGIVAREEADTIIVDDDLPPAFT